MALIALQAAAHEAAHPKTAALALSYDRVELTLELTVAAGEPARTLRLLHDRNRSGDLDWGEQRALADAMVKTALLGVKLTVDGVEVPLQQAAAPRLRGVGEEASSTSLLSVRVRFRGAWPAGSGDWLGRREVALSAESAGPDGHVPVAVSCSGCTIKSFNDGAFHRDGALVDHVLGAQVSKTRPLLLRVRLGRSGLSCGG